MSAIINYKSSFIKKNSSNIILFSDEDFNISALKKHILKADYLFMSDLIKTKDKKDEILSFDLSSKRKIILVSIKKNITSSETENLGAKFYEFIKNFKQHEYHVNSDTDFSSLKNTVGYFLHGIKLKSYKFEKNRK